MPPIRTASDFAFVRQMLCARVLLLPAAALLLLTLAGCEPQAKSQPPAIAPPAQQQKPPLKAAPSPSPGRVEESRPSPRPEQFSPEQSKRRANPTLSDLAATARATEFDLPRLDESKIAAAGIRRVEGEHLILYTDLPTSNEVDELPRVFDAAVPLWCSYFAIEPSKLADWKIVASVMKNKEPFVAAGLFP